MDAHSRWSGHDANLYAREHLNNPGNTSLSVVSYGWIAQQLLANRQPTGTSSSLIRFIATFMGPFFTITVHGSLVRDGIKNV